MRLPVSEQKYPVPAEFVFPETNKRGENRIKLLVALDRGKVIIYVNFFYPKSCLLLESFIIVVSNKIAPNIFNH